MEKKQKIITKVCNYENDTQGLKNINNSQDTTMYFTESVVSQFVKTRDEDHLRFLCHQIKEWLKENKVSVGFVINEDELRDCLEDHKTLKEQIKKLEQEILSLQEDSIRENQINVTETVELEKEINKLKEENIKLKKQQLYFDLLLTRLQWLHKKANEYKEEKERFGLEENLPLDSVWSVLDLQKNKCCEYEEMSELKKGIETIAQEDLLKEIEHNLNFKPTKTEDEIFTKIRELEG